MNWLDLAHGGEMWLAIVNAVMTVYGSLPLWSLLNNHTNYVKNKFCFNSSCALICMLYDSAILGHHHACQYIHLIKEDTRK